MPPAVKPLLEGAFERFLGETEFYRLFLYEIAKPDVRITQEAMEGQMILEALAVKIHTSWEVFVGDLMIDCLSCDTSQYASSMGVTIPQHPPRDVCELMLTGTGILSIGNASEVQGTAKRLLAPGYNPFKEIAKADISAINEFQIIRNYIAHHSRRARRSLEEVYLREYKIGAFIDPGLFLATLVEMHGPIDEITRLGVYLNSFSSAAEKMESYLFPEQQPPKEIER